MYISYSLRSSFSPRATRCCWSRAFPIAPMTDLVRWAVVAVHTLFAVSTSISLAPSIIDRPPPRPFSLGLWLISISPRIHLCSLALSVLGRVVLYFDMLAAPTSMTLRVTLVTLLSNRALAIQNIVIFSLLIAKHMHGPSSQSSQLRVRARWRLVCGLPRILVLALP